MKDASDPTKIELAYGTQKIEIVNLNNIDEDLNSPDNNEKDEVYYELMVFFKHIVKEYIQKN